MMMNLIRYGVLMIKIPQVNIARETEVLARLGLEMRKMRRKNLESGEAVATQDRTQ